MAKQTELKRLLQELEIATRIHEHTNNFSSTPDTKARTFQAVDLTEKRIFSLFDKMRCESESHARASSQNLKAASDALDRCGALLIECDTFKRAADQAQASLQELAKQVMAMKEPAPTATPEPFDEKRAAAGEPIEVLFNGAWHEVNYVGKGTRHDYVVECLGDGWSSGLSYWAPDTMRMASKTQQVQMFANVFRGALDGRMTGALFDTELDAENLAHNRIKHKLIASAVPVTITVAK